ncbi:MAG: Uncharacterised protein [Halieaceae bacterium]|nr:MAG: Uncharacterised protein [Halieaceae bacterium]
MPATGPNKGGPSAEWGMAPFTMRLIPASNMGGMQFIARSSQGMRRSRSSGNNSLSEDHGGKPSGPQASVRPVDS